MCMIRGKRRRFQSRRSLLGVASVLKLKYTIQVYLATLDINLKLFCLIHLLLFQIFQIVGFLPNVNNNLICGLKPHRYLNLLLNLLHFAQNGCSWVKWACELFIHETFLVTYFHNFRVLEKQTTI